MRLMTDMVLPGSGPYTKSVTRRYSIPALAKDAQAGTAGFRLKASISDLTSDFYSFVFIHRKNNTEPCPFLGSWSVQNLTSLLGLPSLGCLTLCNEKFHRLK